MTCAVAIQPVSMLLFFSLARGLHVKKGTHYVAICLRGEIYLSQLSGRPVERIQPVTLRPCSQASQAGTTPNTDALLVNR